VTTLVIDASVAAKWLVNEALSDKALSLLDPQNDLIAPDLLLPEVGNVLWKKTRSGELPSEMALERFDALVNMGVKVVAANALSRRALEIAAEIGRTVYDSLYLALAEVSDCRLVTADARLVNALQNTPWTAHVTFLGDL
jgi:predicted nucleic acid-binding protein